MYAFKHFFCGCDTSVQGRRLILKSVFFFFLFYCTDSLLSGVAGQFELYLALRWMQRAGAGWSRGWEVERDEERHLNLINPPGFFFFIFPRSVSAVRGVW